MLPSHRDQSTNLKINRLVFCFQWVQNENIGQKWVNGLKVFAKVYRYILLQ